MYTLRTIWQDGQHNQLIGENYSLVYKESEPEGFKKLSDVFFGEDAKEDDRHVNNTYCFLICKDGSKVIPLYKGKHYFVMTENGSTFSNLTLK